MSEIKLVKRLKYAGDVHTALMKLGWSSEMAALFLNGVPDAKVNEPVRHGKPHPHIVEFCGSNGEVVVAYQEGWECPFCGEPGVKNFCPECGARMDGADT